MFFIAYWRFSPTIRSEEMIVTVCPPPPGPIYSLDDFINANAKLETFLKSKAGDYYGLDPHICILPTNSGYKVVWASGKAGMEFPKELREAADAIIRDALQVRRHKNGPISE